MRPINQYFLISFDTSLFFSVAKTFFFFLTRCCKDFDVAITVKIGRIVGLGNCKFKEDLTTDSVLEKKLILMFYCFTFFLNSVRPSIFLFI
jgi:hypothetical protein